MSIQPEIRYARSGGVNIGYAVIGDGPIDMLFVPGFVSNLDIFWQTPTASAFFERLSSFCRLIMFDKRGTGVSDRDVDASTPIDVRVDDMRAVLDAAGAKHVALFGNSEGASMSIFFAATAPQRVRSMVLYGGFARLTSTPDYSCGFDETFIGALAEQIEAHWGEGKLLEIFVPSLRLIDGYRAVAGRIERATASPHAAAENFRWVSQLDVRFACPLITVPTLVAHRADDSALPAPYGRWLAENIPGARYFEQPGIDHVPWEGDTRGLLDEIEEFVTGTRRDVEPDRILATVLFTDIVGSTERAAELGDRRWREVLEQHDRAARQIVERFRGKLVKTTGDGLLATFDGPVRAIHAADEARRAMRQLGLEVRAGLHTGEIELRNGDVGGIGVHIGARVAAKAGASEVLVSSTVKDLVIGSDVGFEERGIHELKGVPGEWRLYAVR